MVLGNDSTGSTVLALMENIQVAFEGEDSVLLQLVDLSKGHFYLNFTCIKLTLQLLRS